MSVAPLISSLAGGVGLTMVESAAAAPGEPPPDSVTEFVSRDAALAATLTVTVIAG
jgi:hypothetical protein